VSFETLLELADQAHQDYLRCANPDGSPNERALRDFAYAHGHMFENLGRAVRELLLRQEKMVEGWQRRLTVAEGWCRSLQEASTKADQAREAADVQIVELQSRITDLLKAQGPHSQASAGPGESGPSPAESIAAGENLRGLQARLADLQARCNELQEACDRQSEALGTTAERELALQELLENAQKSASDKYRERMTELEDAAKKDRLARVEAEQQLAKVLSEAGVHQAELLALREKFEVQESVTLEEFITQTLQGLLALQQSQQGLMAQVDSQRGELTAALSENEELKKQLAEITAVQSQRVAEWTTERAALNKKLKETLLSAGAIQQELEALRAASEARQTQFEVLTQQIEAAARRLAEVQDQAAQTEGALRFEIDRMGGELQEVTVERASALEKVTALEAEAQHQAAELRRLVEQAEHLSLEKVSGLKEQAARLREESSQALLEKDVRIQQLEASVQDLNLTVQAASARETDILQEFEKERAALLAEKTEALTEQQSQLDEATRQIGELWSKFEEEKKHSAELSKKLDSAEESRKQLRANKTELEFKAKSAEELAEKAREHLARVEARAENERLLWAEERVQSQARIMELEKDAARLLDEVAKATALAQEMDRAAEEFRKVRDDRDRLAAQAQELEETLVIERLTCPEGEECPVCTHKEWRSLQKQVDNYRKVFGELDTLLKAASESSGLVLSGEMLQKVKDLSSSA
jgi:chromosome segregation ATPase